MSPVTDGAIYHAALDLLLRSVDDSMTPAYVVSRVRKAASDFERGLADGALELRSWRLVEQSQRRV